MLSHIMCLEARWCASHARTCPPHLAKGRQKAVQEQREWHSTEVMHVQLRARTCAVRATQAFHRAVDCKGVGNVAVVEPEARSTHQHGPVVRVLQTLRQDHARTPSD